MQGFSLKEVLP